MDDEIGDDAFHMQRSVGCQRTARHMDLNANVKGMCHIANFLDLADAAAVADIRLCKLEQVFSKITCILPAGKETLSIGNGNLCIFCDILHGLRSRGIRLLKSQDAVLFRKLCKLHRTERIRIGVIFHNDVHFVPGRVPRSLHAGLHHLELFGRQKSGRIQEVKRPALFIAVKKVDLDSVKAFGDRQLDIVGIILWSHRPQVFADTHPAPAKLELACIGAQPAAHLAAQKLIDRNLEIFPLDIPQGHIDRSDPGKDDRAAVLAPEGFFIHRLPDQLCPKRVHPDDKLRQIAHHSKRCGAAHAYVTSQLAYVALKVSRIYTGNARLARRMVVTDKLKSEFISATSHELRTPLHGIINIIESASSKLGEPDTAKEQLSLALMLARKLNSVLNDLYGFYSSEHRSVSLKPVNLDIEVNAVIEVFYYTSDNTKLIFKNNLSKNALWVNADESKLWEVLNNIIGNAVKYTDSGTITISSKRMNGKVYVSVSDTGIGMSAKDISRIFDKSVRLDDTARKAEGVGLGLYLVRQLTEQMNGSVYVEWTKPGQGTCITFCLDACTPDHNSMENAAAAQAGSAYKSQNYLEDFKGTSASLLVVDDNEDNLNIIRTIFEDCSFSMDCVKSAKEALELLEKSSYDIIILDVMMPEMSGFELCQIIRKRYSHFELPVLLLTACDGAEEILTGFWSGANDYVVKPADRIELRTRVFSLITLKQSVKSALDNEMLFLQAQIRPHFLYNAFNTISAIALTDGVKASELIDDLAIYLRGCFGNDVNRGLVTIDTELGIVNSYVHIEQARFGRRLQFKLVQKTGRSFSLPPLTIQPLVENAIRHATLDSYQEIQIQVTITEKNEYIHIEIQDNGVGIEPVKIANLLNEEQDGYQGGIGLRNVSRRLKLHYGIPLDIQTSPGAGTTILIRIPLNSKFQEDELEYGYSSNQQHP